MSVCVNGCLGFWKWLYAPYMLCVLRHLGSLIFSLLLGKGVSLWWVHFSLVVSWVFLSLLADIQKTASSSPSLSLIPSPCIFLPSSSSSSRSHTACCMLPASRVSRMLFRGERAGWLLDSGVLEGKREEKATDRLFLPFGEILRENLQFFVRGRLQAWKRGVWFVSLTTNENPLSVFLRAEHQSTRGCCREQIADRQHETAKEKKLSQSFLCCFLNWSLFLIFLASN